MAIGSKPQSLNNPGRTDALKTGGRKKAAPSYWRSLSARLIFISIIWGGLFLIGGGFLMSQLFSDYLTDALDERLEQYMQSMIGAAQINDEGTLFFERSIGEQRFLEPYSGYYWQVSRPGAPALRSRSLWDQVLPVDLSQQRLSAEFASRDGPDAQRLRALERDVFLPGAREPFRFLVTGDLGAVEEQMARFHKSLYVGIGVLGLSLAAAMFFQIRYGLLPLRRIRRSVAQIRNGQTDRIPEDLPPEVMPLVREMNAFLDQNDKAVDRAKTQAGNLAHALKTPLSILTNEAGQAESAFAETVQRQVSLMRGHIDSNLARARANSRYGQKHLRCDPVVATEAILRAMRKLYPSRTFQLQADWQEAHYVRAAQQDLQEIMGNLLDNAGKFSASQVHIKLSRTKKDNQSLIRICIEDDGPGIPAHEREEIFKRGRRLDETVPGTGLGLGIVADLVEIYDGHIDVTHSKDLGGLKVVLDLMEAAERL